MEQRHFDPSRFDRLNNLERISELRPPELLAQVAGIGTGMTCVDLGSGTGVFARPMADLVGPSGTVYAIDASTEMLGFIRSNHPPENLKLVCADIASTGLAGEIADVCIIAFVLHEVTTPLFVLQEGRRLLRPGGRLVIVEWRPDSDKGPPPDIRIERYSAETMLRTAGLEAEGYVEWSRRHYALWALKPRHGANADGVRPTVLDSR